MPIQDYPSIDYVRQCFRDENGHLFWLRRPRDHFASDGSWRSWNTRCAGTEAGSIKPGCKRDHPRCFICINNISIPRHRIVWAFHKGEWILGLDHENRNPLDDRIDNLRVATATQNQGNKFVSRRNKSGYKGVSWCKRCKKWVAYIRINGKNKNLGLFSDPADAAAVYLDAAKVYFGEFAYDGKRDVPS